MSENTTNETAADAATLRAALAQALRAVAAAAQPLLKAEQRTYEPWKEPADIAYKRAVTEADTIDQAVDALRDLLDDVHLVAVGRRIFADEALRLFRVVAPDEAEAARRQWEADE
jgi:hypothetical protein